MRRKTPLVLMEQLIMILVFALAAAICLRIFVLADQISKKNEVISQAVLTAQNTAEEIKRCGKKLSELYDPGDGMYQYEDGVWSAAYDEAWKKIKIDDTEAFKRAVYWIRIVDHASALPGLLRARILVENGTEVIFEIPVAWQEVTEYE